MKVFKTSEEKYVKSDYFVLLADANEQYHLVSNVKNINFDKVRELRYVEPTPESIKYGDFVDGGEIISANKFVDEYFVKARKNPCEYTIVSLVVGEDFDGEINADVSISDLGVFNLVDAYLVTTENDGDTSKSLELVSTSGTIEIPYESEDGDGDDSGYDGETTQQEI